MLFIVRQATKLVDIGVKSYVDCANWRFYQIILKYVRKNLHFGFAWNISYITEITLRLKRKIDVLDVFA